MARKSNGPLRLCFRFRARRAASFLVSGCIALRMFAISSREACMKSTSSGSGLRSVFAIASTPLSATSLRRISDSISFFRSSILFSNSSRSSRSSSDVMSPSERSCACSINRSSIPSRSRLRRVRYR